MNAVFDLDGTLIDSAPDIHAAGNAVLASEGLGPVTPAQSRSFIGNGAKVYVARLEQAATGGNDPVRTARMQSLFLAEYETAHALTRIYPGVEAALAHLRALGWRLAICTNKPHAPAAAVLRHLGWTDLFDVVIGGDTLPLPKPDPAPLHAAIAGLGIGPVVYVGDSEVDAQTAVAASVPFALFTGGYHRGPLADIPRQRDFEHWSDLPAIAAELVA